MSTFAEPAIMDEAIDREAPEAPETEARRWRPVRVLFYSHDIHKGRQPNVWYVLLDMAGRVVSAKYTRCTLEVDNMIYCVTRDGWRRVQSRTYAFPPTAVVETLADVRALEQANIPVTTSPRRLTVAQIAVAYVLPRRADHCATLIGQVLGFGRVRTPDRLYALLTEGDREGRTGPRTRGVRISSAVPVLASDSATSAGDSDAGGT